MTPRELINQHPEAARELAFRFAAKAFGSQADINTVWEHFIQSLQPEWEIINYKDNFSGKIYRKDDLRTVKYDCTIHTVRYGGIDYSVGDWAISKSNEKFQISKFQILKEGAEAGRLVWYTEGSGWITLDFLTGKAEPKFTTTEGEPVFEGEKYYYPLNGKPERTDTRITVENFPTFKTREATEQWIEENEKRFSLRDVENAIKKAFGIELNQNNIHELKKALLKG